MTSTNRAPAYILELCRRAETREDIHHLYAMILRYGLDHQPVEGDIVLSTDVPLQTPQWFRTIRAICSNFILSSPFSVVDYRGTEEPQSEIQYENGDRVSSIHARGLIDPIRGGGRTVLESSVLVCTDWDQFLRDLSELPVSATITPGSLS